MQIELHQTFYRFGFRNDLPRQIAAALPCTLRKGNVFVERKEFRFPLGPLPIELERRAALQWNYKEGFGKALHRKQFPAMFQANKHSDTE